ASALSGFPLIGPRPAERFDEGSSAAALGGMGAAEGGTITGRRPMKLAFLGTPEVAVPPLRALVEEGHDVRLVVTRADKRRGRGSALVPSPVKAAAQELGLPVTDKVDDAIDAGAELGVVVAFGRIIKPHVLAA